MSELFFDRYLRDIHSNDTEDLLQGDRNFGKYLKDKIRNFEAVHIISTSMINSMKKPQRCIYNSEKYYIAVDMCTNTHYICYKDIMMLDIDYSKSNLKDCDSIIKFLEDKNEHNDTYIIYKTRNGVHAFVSNRTFDFKSESSIEYMLERECDFYYIVYAYIRGWSVRVNKKTQNDPMYEYLCTIGNDLTYKSLIDKHIELIKPCEKQTMYV